MKLYVFKLTMGFQQWLAHLSPSWLVNKTTSLSRRVAKEEFNTWHKSTTMWMTSWVYFIGKPMTTQPRQKQHMKEVSLAKEWNSFHLSRKKLDCLHLKDLLKYDYELYLKQPLTPPQHKIIATYHTSNHRLAIQIGR